MKMLIKGDSVRLGVLRSELDRLLEVAVSKRRPISLVDPMHCSAMHSKLRVSTTMHR